MLIAAHAGQLPLRDNSVQCVVTSPPYWGLRKYAGEQELVWLVPSGPPRSGRGAGGDGGVACEHQWATERYYTEQTAAQETSEAFSVAGQSNADRLKAGRWRETNTCVLCGAWRGAYGLEPTVELYVQHTVEILREIRRVLRPDGVVFWNIGDSYAGGGNYRGVHSMDPLTSKQASNRGAQGLHQELGVTKEKLTGGLKPKDLCLIPQRVALAAQRDGWWVRSDIIWTKPNPMPESCRDRPTDAYEHILMLTKAARYFWDAEAVKEPVSMTAGAVGRIRNFDMTKQIKLTKLQSVMSSTMGQRDESGRNLRNVWTFATQPFAGAHFATFPEELARRCILAATSAKGACRFCGAPWERVVQKAHAPVEVFTKRNAPIDGFVYSGSVHEGEWKGQGQKLQNWRDENPPKTVGWRPICRCPGQHGRTVPRVVLAPFGGSGTTGRVAIELNRTPILVDLAYGRASSEEIAKGVSYDRLADQRTSNVQRNLL